MEGILEAIRTVPPPAFHAAGSLDVASPDRPDTADWIDVVTWAEQSVNRMTALRAQAIELARQQAVGSSSNSMQQRAFAAELAAALTISERTAENLIGTSRVLVETLPATMTALAEGSIGYRHAQIMADQTAGLGPADAAALEVAILPQARTSTPPRFERRVRTARERLRPETIAERHRSAVDSRDVQLEPGRDGMA